MKRQSSFPSCIRNKEKRREAGRTQRLSIPSLSPSGILSFTQANLTNYKTHLPFDISPSLLSSLSPSYPFLSLQHTINTVLPFLPFSTSRALLVPFFSFFATFSLHFASSLKAASHIHSFLVTPKRTNYSMLPLLTPLLQRHCGK